MSFKGSKIFIKFVGLKQPFKMEKIPEAWMRGTKTPELVPLLQPVVDTWTAVLEEIEKALIGFPEERLWEQPAHCASVGFHLLHIGGVVDRLLTYAEGKALSEVQFVQLKAESEPATELGTTELLNKLKEVINTGIIRLLAFKVDELTEPRKVGRAGLPSTVVGLCFHAAEHSMRHTGQLIVTARILINGIV